MQLLGKELRQPLTHVVIFTIGGLRPIHTDMLFEVAVELVERLQQRFVLFAHAEIGQFHALGRNVGVAVGNTLVIAFELCADMLQLAIDRLCLVAFAWALLALESHKAGGKVVRQLTNVLLPLTVRRT